MYVVGLGSEVHAFGWGLRVPNVSMVQQLMGLSVVKDGFYLCDTMHFQMDDKLSFRACHQGCSFVWEVPFYACMWSCKHAHQGQECLLLLLPVIKLIKRARK